MNVCFSMWILNGVVMKRSCLKLGWIQEGSTSFKSKQLVFDHESFILPIGEVAHVRQF